MAVEGPTGTNEGWRADNGIRGGHPEVSQGLQRGMKLEDLEIEDLHALYEHRNRPAALRRVNAKYRSHVRYLVGAIRRSVRKRALTVWVSMRDGKAARLGGQP